MRLDNFDPDTDDLRQLAEQRLGKMVDGRIDADFATSGREDLAEVVHELRVHQIELEMQNEELRRAQLELETSRGRYEELFRLAPVGYVTFNEKGIVGDANSTATELLNVKRQTLLGQPFSPFVFAADRVVYYRTLELLIRSEGRQSADLRLQPLGVEPLWVHLEANPQRSASGELLCFAVTFDDISERIHAAEALRDSQEGYSALIRQSKDGMAITDSDGIVTMWSASMVSLTGVKEREAVGSPIWEIQSRLIPPEQNTPELLEQLQAGFKSAVESATGWPGESREQEMMHADGTCRVVQDSSFIVRTESTVRFCSVFRDVTERIQAEAQVHQQNQELTHLNTLLETEAAALTQANATITRIASMDELTGLSNRRHFHESLHKAISLARRHGSPLAVASFDLDGLKGVNDSEGHEAGDEVLSAFAELLRTACRVEDLPARIGGDEFCVLLPDIDLLGAHELGERVLEAVRSNDALGQRNVTVCGGIAQWVSDEHGDELLRRADQALYAAKNSGGDSLSTAE